MPRVKRGTTKAKKRRELLKQVKGYNFGRSTKKRQAYEAVAHAGNHAFNDRRKKKNVFRQFWHIQISAALSEGNFSFSRFIGALNKKKVGLNKKMLAQIAQDSPESFKRIVEHVK